MKTAKEAGITSVQGLINAYREKQPGGHYFDADTLAWFGEHVFEMRLLKRLQVVEDYDGEHLCLVLSSLQRKAPGGPKTAHHYFDVETMEDIHPRL